MCTDTRFTEANEKTFTTTLIALYTDLIISNSRKRMLFDKAKKKCSATF